LTQLSMFPEINTTSVVPPPGPTRARSAHQHLLMAAGMHPLARLVKGLRLHRDAAPMDDKLAPGLRCRDCALTFRQTYTVRRYLKCYLWPSRGEASDIRMWWPACEQFKAREPE